MNVMLTTVWRIQGYTAFWYVASCNLLDVYRRFGETYCFNFNRLKSKEAAGLLFSGLFFYTEVEVVGPSETSTNNKKVALFVVIGLFFYTKVEAVRPSETSTNNKR
jgi:hypothetical protein